MVNKVQNKMFVVKRDGRKEDVHIDKITSRIQKLCYGLNMDQVDPVSITLKVVNGLYPGVTTVELDTLAAETAATRMVDHPDYGTLAARIAISNLQKETKKHFTEVISVLYENYDDQLQKHVPKISQEIYELVMKYANRLNSCIIYDRDFSFNYFGFKFLEQNYLKKVNGKTVERPQHMFMRVAVGIHKDDIDAVIETYNLLSERYFIHSSNTLHSAAFPLPFMASGCIMMMPSDSIEGIFQCISNCGIVSSFGGNIGVTVHNIRAKGTYIAGTNGTSNGLVPMLRCFDTTAACCYRFGTEDLADLRVYIEPWHADIFEFLNLNKPTGKDELRARNLSYGLWIPDLFMRRVEAQETWSLMCPHMCPGLAEVCGEEFDKLYEKYEAEKKFIKQVPAQDLWRAIVVSQLEAETPSIMYKDHCNKTSNQKHCGVIKCGNQSADAIGISSPEEISVCTQASVSVDMFVSADRQTFDFQKLKDVVKVITTNLDKIIDINHYVLKEEESNLKYRPIGIGVQGLADAFILLKYPFDSEHATNLNLQIFETIYYGALEASCELAKEKGPYPTYQGSPASQGILQYDMWNGVKPSDLWNWQQLKQNIKMHGLRNSLLVAQMPTTSLSQILGNNSSVEPYRSMVFTRRVKSDEFQVVNHHLLRDLTERDIWTDEVKAKILANYGSVQNIQEIPADLRDVYKTVWEIKQKVVLNMAIQRGAFIDQSQSINVYLENPSYASLCSMHFYGWKNGLKTGVHRLKTRTVQKLNNSIEKLKISTKLEVEKKNGIEEKDDALELEEMRKSQAEEEERNMASLVCSLANPEACDMCGA